MYLSLKQKEELQMSPRCSMHAIVKVNPCLTIYNNFELRKLAYYLPSIVTEKRFF